MNDQTIQGQIEAYREGGRWMVMIRLPSWVLRDLRRELEGLEQHGLTALNYSGSSILMSTSFGPLGKEESSE